MLHYAPTVYLVPSRLPPSDPIPVWALYEPALSRPQSTTFGASEHVYTVSRMEQMEQMELGRVQSRFLEAREIAFVTDEFRWVSSDFPDYPASYNETSRARARARGSIGRE